MTLEDELVARCALRRAKELGGLSAEALEVLADEVRDNLRDFVTTPYEQGLATLGAAIDRYHEDAHDDDLRDDDEFYKALAARRQALLATCEDIMHAAPDCVEAQLVAIQLDEAGPDAALDRLLLLDEKCERADGPLPEATDGDAWDDVLLRGRLRVQASISRACLATARYRMAAETCERLMRLSPADMLGARLTCLLAYARLEDEAAFNDLDARYDHEGSAWAHLGRLVLLYKLGRMPAARRALMGFCDLCEGGAFALLRPTFTDAYLLERPACERGSYEEAVLAVHEGDPIICDTPELPNWAATQGDVSDQAGRFAAERGFDW